jgi:tRNA G18 (ribose-2'-O)-methylase SpoU
MLANRPPPDRVGGGRLCSCAPIPAVRLERIDNLGDVRVADYRDLKQGDLLRRRGLFMTEGHLNVRCLIERSRFRTRSVLVTPKIFETLRDVLETLEADSPVYLAPQGVLNGVVGFDLHRGCLAVGECHELDSVEQLVPGGRAASLLVVLEALTNHDNTGGVFRNAMAFGADAALLCPRCSDPLYRKAIRVSMGASLCLPFARFDSWPAGLAELRAAGYSVVALHPRDESLELGELVASARVPARAALLLGTEGAGISREALAFADVQVRIAMAPGFDSLNVATASGIALYQLARRR